MSRPVISIFCSLLILTSCHQEKKTSLTTIDILDGLKTEKEFRLSEIVDNVEYVKLETTPESLLPQFCNFQIGQKYIIAYQRQEPAWIKLFDREGHFLRNIGQEGKGPLEYLSISALQTDPEETFLLLADRNDKLLKFNFQGTVINQVNYQKSFDGTIAEIVIKNSSEIFILLDFPILDKKDFRLVRKLDADLQQIDSLYPVTSAALPEKSGYTWGHGDFYLQDGFINIRPYSFDTLFSAEQKKLVPRFVFPIKTDHLPGPYQVYGIHRGTYSRVSVIHEFPRYLILNARQTDKASGILIYDKTLWDLFSLAKYRLPPPFDQYPQAEFINDIDGAINPAQVYNNISLNQLFYAHEILEMKERVKKDSLGVRQPKFPEKRKEFIEIIKSSGDDDNPILQIFHLKMP